MKIAFDEHIPPRIAAAFKALDGEDGVLRVEIVSARDYAVPKAKSDVAWIEKFSSDGGKIIVSGDTKMRGKLHEQMALVKAGFIVFFLARQWNNMDSYAKSAMLMKWWPEILNKVTRAKRGQFFEIPCQWTAGEMRVVTPPGSKRRKPGRKKQDTNTAHENATERTTQAN